MTQNTPNPTSTPGGELDLELLMLYGKVCSEHGYLSDQAVTMRMDIATLWMGYTANQKIVEAIGKPEETSSRELTRDLSADDATYWQRRNQERNTLRHEILQKLNLEQTNEVEE